MRLSGIMGVVVSELSGRFLTICKELLLSKTQEQMQYKHCLERQFHLIKLFLKQ